ncbi:MAG: hypothetical protein JXB60_07815 [Candidatus Cloacimonetes bacterium]|nr:hypothetical protein [Candidatus Cloacimonadota bacterium]
MKGLLYLIILLFTTVLFALLVTAILGYDLFRSGDLGFLFLIHAFSGSLFLFCSSSRKIAILILAVIILTVPFIFLLQDTVIHHQLKNFTFLILYILLLFSIQASVLYFFWLKRKEKLFSNILVAVTYALFFLILNLLFHIILKLDLQMIFLLRYFILGFIIMLTVTTGLRFGDRIFRWLDNNVL